MQHLRKIPIWLYLMFLAMEILLWVLYTETFQRHQDQIDFIKIENQGIAEILEQQEQLTLLGEYRGSCSAVLIDSSATEKLKQTCADRFSALTNHSKNIDHDHLYDRFTHYFEIPPAQGQAEVFFDQVTQINLQYLDEILRTYTFSNLKLDPADTSYSLAAVYAKQIPWLIELVGQIRGKAALFLNNRISRDEFRQTLGHLIQIQTETESEFKYIDLSKAPEDQKNIKQMLTQTQILLDRYVREIERTPRLGRFESGVFEAEDNIFKLFQTGTAIITQLNQLSNDVKSLLQIELEERSNHYEKKRLNTFASGFVVQLLLFYLLYRLVYFFNDLQQSRLQSERAKKNLQTLLTKQEKLYAIIGHELRTPAASLKMLLDQVLDQNFDPMLVEAKSTSQHLLDVIDDMRISSSNALVLSLSDERPLSVFKILEEVVHSTTSIADQYGIRIHLEGKKSSNYGHYGSPKFIRQLVLNLIKNGLIHSQASDLWVRLTYESLADTEATRFCIQIVDNGVGIPTEDQARLFEAFERGNTKSEGSGLGLHICQQLASTLRDGALIYKPNLPKGSIFELNFTLDRIASEQPSREIAQVNLLKDKKILLVEDTPTLRMLSCKILRNQGAIVTEAYDGIQGLAKATEKQFDIIITDIMMPGMNGYEMTAALRKQGFSAPIIGVTGATVGDEAEKLLNAGASAVLAKPLMIQSLNAELAKILTQDNRTNNS